MEEISIEDGEGPAVVERAEGRRLKKVREDRHVSFVSPVKETGSKKGRK